MLVLTFDRCAPFCYEAYFGYTNTQQALHMAMLSVFRRVIYTAWYWYCWLNHVYYILLFFECGLLCHAYFMLFLYTLVHGEICVYPLHL